VPAWTVVVTRLDELVFPPELYFEHAGAEAELHRWISFLAAWEVAPAARLASHHWTVGSIELRLSRQLQLPEDQSHLWIGTTWSWLGGVDSTILLAGRRGAWDWATTAPAPGVTVKPEVFSDDRIRVALVRGDLSPSRVDQAGKKLMNLSAENSSVPGRHHELTWPLAARSSES
jgi:hypothetical protein